MIGMNLKMNAFIQANAAILTTNGYMPATFAAKVSADSDGFAAKYAAFKVARQTSEKTAEKVRANNALYKSMMDFMADGQMLFSDKDEMKKLFTFSVLKSLVSPPGSASLKVAVKNNDGTPAEGVKVTIKANEDNSAEITAVSDTNGEALFNNIDAEVYDVSVGFAKVQHYTKEVNTGVDARLEAVSGG
jgi:5-hydroxyisourate hydrolase-like protein (transthyretin family)